MNPLETVLEACGLLLNIVLVVLLFRGFLPKYSALFVYNLAAFLITISEQILFQGADRGSSLYRRVYWSSEIVWDFLLLLLLAVLIRQALAGRPEWRLARKVLLIVVVIAVVLPFIVFHDHGLFDDRWFRGASQVWNFGAAILTLVLWGALIASREKDSQLLMVCAGLGIAVAGSALAWGIRKLAVGSGMAETIHNMADLFASLTYVTGLGLWCWAFRSARQPSPPEIARVT